MKLLKKAVFAIFFCLLIIQCKNPQALENNATIALYSGNGSWEESVEALKNMFNWMGQDAMLIDAKFINQKSLDNFNLICFPGGNMYQYSHDISSGGKEKIRTFIRDGGGYVGICGGAYFASEKVIWRGNRLPMTSLNLYSGTAQGPVDKIVPYPEYGMCQVNIEDVVHPIIEGEKSPMWMLYYWGPALIPADANKVTILARYDAANYPAMLCFQYGEGRVFLIGTHPEIEEDSDRDGVSWGDDLDDRGSDWNIMKKAVLWCAKKTL